MKKRFAKYLSADGCFLKTIILLTIQISVEVLKRFICLAARPLYLDKSFDLEKNWTWSCALPRHEQLLQIIETMQNFSLLSNDGAIV